VFALAWRYSDDRNPQVVKKLFGLFQVDWFFFRRGCLVQGLKNKHYVMMQGFVYPDSRFYPVDWVLFLDSDDVDQMIRFPRASFENLR
jgi:hypothetical protein